MKLRGIAMTVTRECASRFFWLDYMVMKGRDSSVNLNVSISSTLHGIFINISMSIIGRLFDIR